LALVVPAATDEKLPADESLAFTTTRASVRPAEPTSASLSAPAPPVLPTPVSTLPETLVVLPVARPSATLLASATVTGSRSMLTTMVPLAVARPPVPWSWPVPATPPVALLFWSLKTTSRSTWS